jgi:hypothetical protein
MPLGGGAVLLLAYGFGTGIAPGRSAWEMLGSSHG